MTEIAPDRAADSPEARLAAFVVGPRPARLPRDVEVRVQHLLLDAIASALAGRQTVEIPAMTAAARALGDDRDTTVIGGGRLSLPGATLLNGYQVTAATVCDVHRPTLCHVTPVVVPPALAIAERERCTGAELVAALAAGFETTVRIGLGTGYPRFRARGWHSPGVVGPFGAAAAVARLLRLDETATRNALGFAGSQAAGTFAGLGSSQVKFHQARAGLSGLLAALVAAEGFDAGQRFLTATDGGLLSTYSDGGDPDRITAGLGERWELMDISMRRWPAASSLQPVIQAVFELIEDPGVDIGRIEHVRIDLPEHAYRLNGSPAWHDQLSAFQSAAYVASVVLLDRACWIQQFSAERIGRPDVAELAREHVGVAADASLPAAGARVTVAVHGGDTRIAMVTVPSGDPGSPLSEADLRAKLAAATAGTPLEARADRIVELVLTMEAQPHVTALLAELRSDEVQALASGPSPRR